jgi:hypothetical protein
MPEAVTGVFGQFSLDFLSVIVLNMVVMHAHFSIAFCLTSKHVPVIQHF